MKLESMIGNAMFAGIVVTLGYITSLIVLDDVITKSHVFFGTISTIDTVGMLGMWVKYIRR
jgi:hypothetical protein